MLEVQFNRLYRPFLEHDFFGQYPAEEYLLNVMPHLTALKVVRFDSLMTGVPSYFVEAMAIAPQLTAIHVLDHCYWPRTYGRLLKESPVIPCHMKEFTWVHDLWSNVDDNYVRDERAFFLSFIPRMRPTLQMLKVPMESLCYQELLTSPWPHLFELSMIGQNPPAKLTANVDFSPLFFNIPSLRNFTILLPQSEYLLRIRLQCGRLSGNFRASKYRSKTPVSSVNHHTQELCEVEHIDAPLSKGREEHSEGH